MKSSNEKKFAAAYVRMSTEHQNYSTENQMDVIRKYAYDNKMEIIEVFADEGKSGVQIRGRDSIERMFETIEKGNAKFSHILVYDVSRWGRFQDADESAFYEFKCKRAGIKVHYCAEMFQNDGSLISTLSKGVKRIMAGEYIRELSVKVLRGQCNLILRGFKQSGSAGFGLRRALVDEKGNPKGIVLENGQRKSIQSDRVILIKGPEEEVRIVNRIYRMFIDELKKENEIAQTLNLEEIKTDLGRMWTCGTIRQILTNEKYIGNSVFNRTSQRVAIQDPLSGKKSSVKNPPAEWVRYDNAFEPIVGKKDFLRVQEIMALRTFRYSDAELIEKLRDVYKRHGKISAVIIDEEENMPSSAVFAQRFGSLVRAYSLVDYTPERDYSFIEINKFVRNMHSDVVDTLYEIAFEKGAFARDKSSYDDGLILNDEVKISLSISRCRTTASGRARWVMKFERSKDADFYIVVRLDSDNKTIKDYYIISKFDIDLFSEKIWEDNGMYMDTFRVPDARGFFEGFSRTQIRDVS